MNKIKKLYTEDSTGRIRTWECQITNNEDGLYGIQYRDGIQGGKIKEWQFKEAKEKNVGRANHMTPENQAIAMVDMEEGKKLRKNYFKTEEDAKNNKLFMPMLAHKFEKYVSKLPKDVCVQPKLDGARCNIYWCNIAQKVVARTRTGKDYSAVLDHVVEEVVTLLTQNKSLVLDGELYNHELKENFEKMMSLVRQGKPGKWDMEQAVEMIEYHVYDVYNKDNPAAKFDERDTLVKLIFNAASFKYLKQVPTIMCNLDEHQDIEDAYLELGYEGIMVRLTDSTYKVDGRSQGLLKKKVFTDAEFEILEVVEGEGSWKGCAKKLVIRLPDGRTQSTGIDGSAEINKERLENKHLLIGKLATVRYFRLTSDNKLYIPVCKDINRHD